MAELMDEFSGSELSELVHAYLDAEKTADAAYIKGMKYGVRRFAWWKDGVQYVGTTGRTLQEALADIDKGSDVS